MNRISLLRAATALALLSPLAAPFAAVAQNAATTSANAEDARLTTFLDGRYAQELQFRPQLAQRGGLGQPALLRHADLLTRAGEIAQAHPLAWH